MCSSKYHALVRYLENYCVFQKISCLTSCLENHYVYYKITDISASFKENIVWFGKYRGPHLLFRKLLSILENNRQLIAIQKIIVCFGKRHVKNEYFFVFFWKGMLEIMQPSILSYLKRIMIQLASESLYEAVYLS